MTFLLSTPLLLTSLFFAPKKSESTIQCCPCLNFFRISCNYLKIKHAQYIFPFISLHLKENSNFDLLMFSRVTHKSGTFPKVLITRA